MNDLSDDLMEQIPIININRKGSSNNSYLKCQKIIRIIEKYIKYKIRSNDLLITNQQLTQQEYINITKPNNLNTFYANVVYNKDNLSYDIFEHYNYLILNKNTLDIPVIVSNQNNFNYFGVKLHKIGDVIEINTPNKIFLNEVHIGDKYLQDYILQKDFSNGLSLELHDSYHYYQPLNSNSTGYIILAKPINLNQYEIAALKIPYGFAITISSYIHHSHATLIGEYLIAYGITQPKNYTKLNIHNKKNEIVKINFI